MVIPADEKKRITETHAVAMRWHEYLAKCDAEFTQVTAMDDPEFIKESGAVIQHGRVCGLDPYRLRWMAEIFPTLEDWIEHGLRGLWELTNKELVKKIQATNKKRKAERDVAKANRQQAKESWSYYVVPPNFSAPAPNPPKP